jgi:hypothetical protein
VHLGAGNVQCIGNQGNSGLIDISEVLLQGVKNRSFEASLSPDQDEIGQCQVTLRIRHCGTQPLDIGVFLDGVFFDIIEAKSWGESMKTISSVATAALALFLVGAYAHAQTPVEKTSPQRSLPYAAIHNPEFIPASEATFVQPDDRVIGVVIGKVAKAYPAGILSQHGLVEDQSPTGPIAITW